MQTEIVFSPSQRSCNLCFAFEHKHHPLVGVYGDVVDGAVPEFFVEDYGQSVQLTQFKHHAADGKAQQARAA